MHVQFSLIISKMSCFRLVCLHQANECANSALACFWNNHVSTYILGSVPSPISRASVIPFPMGPHSSVCSPGFSIPGFSTGFQLGSLSSWCEIHSSISPPHLSFPSLALACRSAALSPGKRGALEGETVEKAQHPRVKLGGRGSSHACVPEMSM